MGLGYVHCVEWWSKSFTLFNRGRWVDGASRRPIEDRDRSRADQSQRDSCQVTLSFAFRLSESFSLRRWGLTFRFVQETKAVDQVVPKLLEKTNQWYVSG